MHTLPQHNKIHEGPTASDVTDLTAMTSLRRTRHQSQETAPTWSRKRTRGTDFAVASTLTSRRRMNFAPSTFHLYAIVLFVLMYSTCVTGQTLPVRITPSKNSPLEEQLPVTLECSLNTQTSGVPAGTNPLSWSRDGGLPPASSVVTDSTPSGTTGVTTYTSRLTFTVLDSTNGRPITCSAVVGSRTGSVTYTPEVLMVPDTPVITGPTEINAGQVYTWTCVSDGSGIVGPNVYFRGNGVHLNQAETPKTQIKVDQYGNRIYEVTVVLNTSLNGAGQFNLSCHVVHWYNNDLETTKVSFLMLNIRSAPVLTKNTGNNVTTTEGVSTTLSCVISAAFPAVTSLTWTKDGVAINPNTNPRYQGGTVNTPSLTIVSASRSDRGSYQCTAVNSIGSGSFQTPTFLVVRYKPEIVYTGSTQFQGNAGGSLTLPCPAVSIPDPSTIRWFRTQNGVDSFINVFASNSRYSGSSNVPGNYGLVINSLQLSDEEGSYYCNATNDVGQTKGQSVTVKVNSAPVITTPNQNVAVNEGRSVTLGCVVTSLVPVESVTWLKGTETVTINGRFTGGTTTTPSLTISSATKADTGQYRCRVTNSAGTSLSGIISLNVKYAPVITLPTQTVNALPGSTVRLQCPVDANPGITLITWTRVQIGTININSNPRLSGGTTTNPTLTISNVGTQDSDQYSCVVTNEVGTTNSPLITLSVTSSPVVTVPTRTFTVEEGTAFTAITCSVVAAPAITELYWTKDGVRLTTPQTGKYNGGTTTTPSLTILSLARTDSGTYVCVARNTEGTGQSQDVTVTVTYQPTLTLPSQSVTGQKDSQITLTATFSAVPTVTDLYWTKNGVRINLSTPAGKYTGGTISVPSLTIRNLDETTDPGDYRLVAVNTRGTTTSDPVRLDVSFEPTVTVDPVVTGVEGTGLTIPCRVSMFPQATVLRWYKDNARITVTNGRYTGGSATTPSLTITDPSKGDTGAYSCEASNGQVNLRSSDSTVTITYVPQITLPQTRLTVNKGDTATLPVSFDSTPAPSVVYWSKTGSGRITVSGRFSGSTPSSPNLVITNVEPSDSGQYTFTAINTVGEITTPTSLTLNVEYAPENAVVTIDPDRTLQLGESFEMTCAAAANPAPTFEWFRGGVKLGDGSTLSKRAEVQDFGNIRCSVANSRGTTTTDKSVPVIFAPVSNIPSPSTVSVSLDSSRTLTCDVLANPEPTGYVWRRNGEAVIANGRQYTVTIDDNSDYGRYTCTATNSQGTGNVTYVVVRPTAPAAGASTGDDGLSTVTIILIVIIIITLIIILIFIIVFCCMSGKCGGKTKEQRKVAPQGPVYGGDRGAGFSPTQSPRKPNGDIHLDEESGQTSTQLPSGLIISVPEKTGGRAHHLPPLENAKEEENYYRNEKRRSRKKKKHRKHDDEGGLTVTEGGYEPM